MKRKGLLFCLAALFAACLMWGPTTAEGAFQFVRIGDVDGFGYGTAPGFVAANGGLANLNGVGVLGDMDFLPDIPPPDTIVATGRGDDFDLRSGEGYSASGAILGGGMAGVDFTDISLSTSYNASSTAGEVLLGGNPSDNNLVFGAGGAFPSNPSTTLPNQPGFKFDFMVAKGDLAAGTKIFFNLIFGDFDVEPAEIDIITNGGATKTLTLTRQSNNQGQDGLIQAATALLDFADVFSDSGANWTGSLMVNFDAPREPYTAFDYVELSTTSIIPEPSTILSAVMGLGMAGCVYRRKRKV